MVVRPKRAVRLAALFALEVMLSSGAVEAQDFDPAGRQRHKHEQPRPATNPSVKPAASGTRMAPAAKPAKPAQQTVLTVPSEPPAQAPAHPSRPAESHQADGPSSEVLIERYTALLLTQPTAALALQRLSQVYRQRDGDLAKLEMDFERRARSDTPERHAARIALAGIYVQSGRLTEAGTLLREAISDRPRDPAPRLSLAELEKSQGHAATARATYEGALALITGQDRDQALRALIALALDAGDFEAARRFHREIVRTSQNSVFVRAELGRELLSRGQYREAEQEFRELLQAASGDPRTLAPALRDLGRALAKQGKNDDALATLQRALVVAGAEPGLRAEILQLEAELYREADDLASLIAKLAAEHPLDRERLTLLGGLYEETGDVDRALATYRQALHAGGRNVDLRLKVLHLLQTRGDLEEATREYEALIRDAPHNPEYVFELCETLVQRGERTRALTRLAALEARASGDEETLARLADFYDKLGEKQKAIQLLARLSARAPFNPEHIADLGDRYFQQGDRKRALEIWGRIKTVLPNRAKALARLGDIYLDHDMAVEALETLRESLQLEPNNVAYMKSYASALERNATASGASSLANMRYEEARVLWERVLESVQRDPNQAKEARAHIVTLWSLLHQLEQRIRPLEKRLSAQPPDPAAGRLLAEVHLRLHRLSDAEATLRTVTRLTPGDAEVWLALERVLVQAHDLPGAIRVLERLVQIDPKRAREFYQRMAQYAAELYRDDDAIAYASKAVQLSPDDADGHKKLGEMYEKKQDTGHAIQEFRSAISKNDQLFPVYFELARLLLTRGEVEEADQLLRRVVRSAPDDEMISQAARQSMQINLGRGGLEVLEKDLLPLAIGKPRKPVYRRLLVELYGALAFPLIQKAQAESVADAEAARQKLRAIGTRAVKPVLDALSDEKEAQQRVAVDLLAFIENRSAGPALFAFATGTAEQALRVRAMVACGSLRDPALLPKYEMLLIPKGDPIVATSDPLSTAAAWSVARLRDAKAIPLLGKLLRRGSPEVRALAAVGLGLSGDRGYVPEIARMAASAEAGNLARAAAGFALGALGANEARGALLAMAQEPDRLPRQAGILALARLQTEGAADAVADALLAQDSGVRESAVLASLVLATGEYRQRSEALPVPTGPIDVRAIVSQLAPDNYSAENRAAAMVRLGPHLERAVKAALETSPERASVVAEVLTTKDALPGFAPLTDGLEQVTPNSRDAARAAAEHIAEAAVPGFSSLARHPAPTLRARAVQFLARRAEKQAQTALAEALEDRDATVRSTALAVIGPGAGPLLVRSVIEALASDENWALRVRAAQTLGRMGQEPNADRARALAVAVRTDAYALVRESALRSLLGVDPNGAKGVLREVADHDPEERVRSLARDLLWDGKPHVAAPP